jgi:hypothetical protein
VFQLTRCDPLSKHVRKLDIQRFDAVGVKPLTSHDASVAYEPNALTWGYVRKRGKVWLVGSDRSTMGDVSAGRTQEVGP